jgi:hypothetical protein
MSEIVDLIVATMHRRGQPNFTHEDARAIMLFIREPTDNMMIAGQRAHSKATLGREPTVLPATTWRAMIDEALK